MSRAEKILAGLDLDRASGIEIGPLDKPLVPPSTSRVFYVDHADTAALREKYRDDRTVDTSKIVDVHGVWGSKTLSEVVAPVVPVDYIVASHVIEHVPDLVGWLQELAAVLRDGGEVRLAVPDRRHTFDYLRRETQLAEVLEAYFVRARVPGPRCILDAILNVRNVDCRRSWDESLGPDDLPPHVDPEVAISIAKDTIAHGTYHDVHCWVFTPQSFARLMLQLAENGYLPFECRDLQDSERYTVEFLCTLGKCGSPERITASWRHAVTAIDEASRAPAPLVEAPETPQPPPVPEAPRGRVTRLVRALEQWGRSGSRGG